MYVLTMHRRASWLLPLAFLSLMPAVARSQEASESDGKALIKQAFEKTKTLETIEDASEILRLLQQADERPLSDALKGYVAELTAWARNRRGELYVEQATELAEQGQQEQAAELDAKALNDFETAIARNPDYWKAIHNVGVSRAIEGDFETALKHFSRVVQLNPDYANAWFNRGEIRFDQGDHTQALEDYSEALKRASDDPAYRVDIRMRRALTLMELQRYNEAIAEFGRAIEADPQRAEVRLVRGDAYRRMGRWGDAAADYREAIRLDQRLGKAYQAAAWLTATCPDPRYRDPDLSQRAAERALQLEGESDYRSQDAMAAAYASAGDFAEAQKHIAAAIAAAPD